jgi:glyoxylase-like metal-dependent hydrolase (beta-lactamase superfamily II)
MQSRVLLVSVFASMAAAAFFVTRTQAAPNQVSYVAPGVWFREGDFENFGHSNNIIIEMKDYLIVVDANYPSGARATLSDVRRISDKPVKYVFDTHHHGDHVYGNAVWTNAGATTLGYAGVVEEMQRLEPARWREESKFRKDLAELSPAGPEPPKQTFEKSPFVLKDGNREVRFYHYGWGHTRDDAFVYLPKEKILCTGDAAVNGPYNNLNDAYISNWPKMIKLAQQLGAEIVLPGHGPSGGKDILDGQLLFLNELYKNVESAVSSGKKLEDLVPPGEPAKTTIKLPDKVKRWSGNSLPAQVRATYEEITQKKPHGDLAH